MLSSRSADAIEPCEAAIRLAQQGGEAAIESHARNTLGISLAALGDLEDGLAQLRRARDLALEARAWDDVARAYGNECSALAGAGRHAESLAAAVEGVEIARLHGLSRQIGMCLRPSICEELWVLGRWDDMEEELGQIEAEPGSVDTWSSTRLWAEWRAGRGDFAGARADLERFRTLLGSEIDVPWQVELLSLGIEVALWEGDLGTAIDLAQEGMDTTNEGPLCADTPASLALPLNAMAAAAQLASQDAPREGDPGAGHQLGQRFATRFQEWIDGSRWGPGRPGDLAPAARQIAAELAVIEGRGEPEEWCALAEDWLAFGEVPRAAYARWREAELRLAAGDRSSAEAAALAAFELADSIGWQWVRDGVADLARRGRLDIKTVEPAIPDAAADLSLTAREVEVLGLLAEGRTNRQIAESLYISTKTASAHVSNLLMKLGVSNRAEAGAAARRLGLD